MAVTAELRVTLPGSQGSADARYALAILDRVLTLLGRIENVVVAPPGRADRPTAWGLTDISLGSLVTTLAPSKPRPGSTSHQLDAVMANVVDGFEAAQERSGVPLGWDRESAKAAVALAEMLGLLPATGMILELLREREPVKRVVVTSRSAEHLRAGMRVQGRSIGAVTGRLDTLSGHGGYKAGLWQDGTSNRIEVRFDAGDEELLREAWRRRVMISGELVRDASGRPVRITMRSIEVLPDATRPLTDLAGIDPDITDGLDPADYLREIRGAP